MSDEQNKPEAPSGLEGWRAVWREDRKFPTPEPPNPLARAIVRILRRYFLPALRNELERQRNFNLATLELVDDLRGDLSTLAREREERLAEIRTATDRALDEIRSDLRKVVEDFRRDIGTMQRDLESTASDHLGLIRRIETLIPHAVERNDALAAALDQKIERLSGRLRDLASPSLSVTSKPEPSVALRDDFLYRRLEDALRGSGDEVRATLAPYLERLRDHAPVVDVGCGRGELLEICRDAGIPARGFDVNERSVAELKSRGLEVELAGIPALFDRLADDSVGTVFASHVVEHLDNRLVVDLFAGARRVLREGGLLVIETPNAESLAMAASEFWRDPTHLVPRHRASLSVLAREYRFDIVEAKAVHPWSSDQQLSVGDGAPVELKRLVERLNEILFAPQDLRLVLRKS